MHLFIFTFILIHITFQTNSIINNNSNNLILTAFSNHTFPFHSFKYTTTTFPTPLTSPWQLHNDTFLHSFQRNLFHSSNFSFYHSLSEPSHLTFSYHITSNTLLNLYINNTITYTSQTELNTLHWMTKSFPLQQGNTSFTFEHFNPISNFTSSSSSIHEVYISYILIASSKQTHINSLSQLKLPQCEYDNICNSKNDYCTERFYSYQITPECDVRTGLQIKEYKLIPNASCYELTQLPQQDVNCVECKFGMISVNVNSTFTKCVYCENGSIYVNGGKCMSCEGRKSKKVFHYKPQIPNYASFDVNIIENVGYVVIYVDKYNYLQQSTMYIEVEHNADRNIHYVNQYTDVDEIHIALVYGVNTIVIKGTNINIYQITIFNSNKGGGYECKDVNDDDDNNEQSNINECPSYSHLSIDNTHCEIDSYIYDNIHKLYFDMKEFMMYNAVSNSSYDIVFNDDNEYMVYSRERNVLYGRDIERIDIVKGGNKVGLLLRMRNGDICEYDNNNDKKYNAYMLFECDRSIDSNDIKYDLIYNDTNTCEMYFTGKNKLFCPVCLENEVKVIQIMNRKGIILSKETVPINNNICQINEQLQAQILNNTYNNNNTLESHVIGLNYNDKQIMHVYNIRPYKANTAFPNEQPIIIINDTPIYTNNSTTNILKTIITLLMIFIIMISIIVYYRRYYIREHFLHNMKDDSSISPIEFSDMKII